MRAAVVLGALAIKSFLWLRTMTPREWIALAIAASVSVALTIAILSERRPKPNSGSGPFCGSAPTDYDGFQSCQFKLRDA